MENWDELRTATVVAQEGTVSGAAAVLGVHHATVIRHVDALEARLGVKLFQRHARGYTPTEAGEDLMRVGQATVEQFTHLESRIKGRGEQVEGELIVTTLAGMAPLITPLLAELQEAHPKLAIRLETSGRLFRMEYGEAHVAIRAGAKPEHPDNVVQQLAALETTLYASDAYVDRFGMPENELACAHHRFVGAVPSAVRAPFHRWMEANISPDQVFFRASDDRSVEAAIRSGIGIGFMGTNIGDQSEGLHRICDPKPEWTVPIWLVTHVDLHRTGKVQAAVQHLKKHAPALFVKTA